MHLRFCVKTFLNVDNHVKLFNIFNEIEQILKYHQVIQIKTVSLRRNLKFVILYWAFQTFEMSELIILILLKVKNMKDLNFSTTYAIPFFFSKLSYVYIIILVVVSQKIVNTLMNFSISLSAAHGDWTQQKQIILNVLSSTYRRLRRNKINFSTVLFLRRSCGLIWKAAVLPNYIFYYSLPIGFEMNLQYSYSIISL